MSSEKKTPEYHGVEHIYDDDIHEQDNRLPLWWQYTLYGAVVFAAIYWFAEYHLHALKPTRQEFDDQRSAELKRKLEKGGGGAPSPDMLAALAKDPAALESGKQIFTTTCAACHRADGGGNIGPNLTDDAWLNGGKPDAIWKTVHDGVPTKGMPTWGPQLGDNKTASVVAYVLTLKNTNVANGKAPQGEKEL